MHERAQHVQLVRSRDEVAEQALVEPRRRLEEACETFGSRHRCIVVDDAVLFEELEADLGLEIERCGTFEEYPLVRLRLGHLVRQTSRQRSVGLLQVSSSATW